MSDLRTFAKETLQKERDKAEMTHDEKKAQLALDKAREKNERAEARIIEFNQTIEKFNVYFLSDVNKYGLTDSQGGNVFWTFIQPEAAAKLFNLANAEDKRTFDAVLRELGRIKLRSVNSFNPQPDSVLNLMSREKWLQPEDGEYDPIFDVLMTSLSGGRQNVRDHIEKVLVYKYLHPECYRLPCITISGEGGVGKNEFIEQVLATIFGKQQIAVVGTDEAFGQFNGQMLGKTVVFIDEALVDKTNTESLKRKVGNETIQINMKFGIQGTFDNTPWYWLGGNGTNGAVMLAGDLTDRRYSVLTVKHSVMHWVAKHLGMDVDTKVALPDSHPCVQWYATHAINYTERSQVAKWLGSLIAKCGDQKGPPSALHDTDYKLVLEKQKSSVGEVIDMVFNDKKFTHIEASTLYTIYKLEVKENNPRGGLMKKTTFLDQVKLTLEKSHPEITFGKVTVNTGLKRTSSYVFKGPAVNSFVKRNNEYYIYTNDKGQESLIERTTEVDDRQTVE